MGILYMWVIIENILKDKIIHLILANKDLLRNVSYGTRTFKVYVGNISCERNKYLQKYENQKDVISGSREPWRISK